MSVTDSSRITPPGELRPLPNRPNLEFERKRAKKLLAQMRQTSESVQLSDAQLVIAREYGFSSWPRLVRYYRTAERELQHTSAPTDYGPEHYEQQVRSLEHEIRLRLGMAAAALSTWVPRFIGKKSDDVLSAEVTRAELQLVVARRTQVGSWEELINRPVRKDPSGGHEWFESWRADLKRALDTSDLDVLKLLIRDHPELLLPPSDSSSRGIADSALRAERSEGLDSLRGKRPGEEARVSSGDARKVSDWLVSQGVDFSAALARRLIGWQLMSTEAVEFWLARGADPNWLPSNGITIVEHAATRYFNGEALDVLAKRVTPRKSFWLAAALGDAKSVARYFDANGSLTQAAHRSRPDISAMGPGKGVPCPPEAEDKLVIAEAFFVAAMNNRHNILDLFIDRGFSPDYNWWGQPYLNFAVIVQNAALAEHLVKRGASTQVKGYLPGSTAQEQAELEYHNNPSSATALRILRACSPHEPEDVLRAYAALPKEEPRLVPPIVKAMDVAKIVAARAGGREVTAGSLFVGMLSTDHAIQLHPLHSAGVDIRKLRSRLASRIIAPEEQKDFPDIPIGAEVNTIVQIAFELIAEKQWHIAGSTQVLRAMLRDETGSVAKLLCDCGATVKQLNNELEKY